MNLADGSYWVYDYDALGQVRSGKRFWVDHTPVPGQQFEYGFDDIGNRTSSKNGGDSSGAGLRTSTYTVNLLNQYTQRTVPGGLDVIGLANAGQSVSVNGSSADYRRGEYFQESLNVSNGASAVWQVVSVTTSGGGSASGNVFVAKTPELLAYDLDGNTVSDGRWDYYWDAENRLVSLVAKAAVGQPLRLDFEYDTQGRRIRKRLWNNTSGTGSPTLDRRYVYDGWNVLVELDGTNGLVQSYVWGLDLSGSLQGAGGVGGLVAVRPAGSPARFSVFDGNGNVTALVNGATGQFDAQYEYGPFGEVLRASGAMSKVNPFRFSTKYQDDETEFLYYGYRYYDARNGRWVNRDPIEEITKFRRQRAGPSEPNVYSFVVGDPISSFDPLGLATYRFEVVVGDRVSTSGAGSWAQPAWAGDGDKAVNGSEAWSKVSVSNERFLGRDTSGGDYCNTVDWKNDFGHAGEIQVFAGDPCGGKFQLAVFFSTYLFGDGPIKIKSSAYLIGEGRTLWSGRATGSPHAEMVHSGIYRVNFSLKANQEQLVLKYTPQVNFPIPLPGAGYTTGNAHGYLSVLSLKKQ